MTNTNTKRCITCGEPLTGAAATCDQVACKKPTRTNVHLELALNERQLRAIAADLGLQRAATTAEVGEWAAENLVERIKEAMSYLEQTQAVRADRGASQGARVRKVQP